MDIVARQTISKLGSSTLRVISGLSKHPESSFLHVPMHTYFHLCNSSPPFFSPILLAAGEFREPFLILWPSVAPGQ